MDIVEAIDHNERSMTFVFVSWASRYCSRFLLLVEW